MLHGDYKLVIIYWKNMQHIHYVILMLLDIVLVYRSGDLMQRDYFWELPPCLSFNFIIAIPLLIRLGLHSLQINEEHNSHHSHSLGMIF